MSLLTIIQNAATELKLQNPSSVINNTDEQVRLLLRFANRSVEVARKQFNWPQLSKELTWTLVSGQASYAFASDHDRMIFDTHWDRSNHWALIGPMSPQEWQVLKSGTITSFPHKRYRIKGFQDNQIYIDPTPGADEDGQTLVFEYMSKTCVRPQTWVTGTTFNTLSYCFYNGNFYYSAAGGTAGATPPTHTSGTVSDGGVYWAYYSAAYTSFLADTDVSLIDEDAISQAIIWRWLRANGLEYLDFKQEADDSLKQRFLAIKGTRSLYLGRGRFPKFLSSFNVPDTGYGS